MTAVEYLLRELKKYGDTCPNYELNYVIEIPTHILKELEEQAKEMEKERMIEFAEHCLDKSIDLDILMAYNQVEIEYTNQTFKSE